MLILMLNCSTSSPIDFPVGLASAIALQRRKIAILDMSRGYLRSMVAQEWAMYPEYPGGLSTLPLRERIIIPEELDRPTGYLKFRRIPVYVERDSIYSESFRNSLTCKGTDIPRTNLECLLGRFEVVIGIAEFVLSDFVAALLVEADLVLLQSDSGTEADLALMQMSDWIHKRVVLSLAVSVSSRYRPKVSVLRILRDRETARVASYLKKMAHEYPPEKIVERITARMAEYQSLPKEDT